MAKRKPRTLAKEIQHAAELLQKLVRLKHADDNGYVRCTTCPAAKPWQEMQGGHFISRVYLAHRLMEENVWPQCPACNGPLRGNLIAYTTHMIDAYGREFVDWLESTKRDGRKYTKAEVIALQEDFKSRIKSEEVRLGIRSGAA